MENGDTFRHGADEQGVSGSVCISEPTVDRHHPIIAAHETAPNPTIADDLNLPKEAETRVLVPNERAPRIVADHAWFPNLGIFTQDATI